MPDIDRIKGNINLVRILSNEVAAFLYKLPDDVWRDPTRFASGCKNWNVSDVISHLIDQANHTTLSIDRAIKVIARKYIPGNQTREHKGKPDAANRGPVRIDPTDP